MASVRELKKDINFVVGDFIEAVYLWEADTQQTNSEEGNALIDRAIGVFDDLMKRVHSKEVDNSKTHFKSIRESLATEATKLVEELNKLGK